MASLVNYGQLKIVDPAPNATTAPGGAALNDNFIYIADALTSGAQTAATLATHVADTAAHGATAAATANKIALRDSLGRLSAAGIIANGGNISDVGNITSHGGNFQIDSTGQIDCTELHVSAEGFPTSIFGGSSVSILVNTSMTPTSAASVALTINGKTSQAGNLTEWKNVGGSVVASVSPTGILTGDGSGLTALNATNISSGTIGDARLSSNVPLKNAANTFTANQSVTGTLAATKRLTSGVVALTDGATINTDASLGNTFTVTLGGSRTMAAPSNATAGQRIVYQIKQGAGSQTLTWTGGAGGFRFSGASAPTLTTTTAKTDYLTFVYNAVDSRWDCVGERFNF